MKIFILLFLSIFLLSSCVDETIYEDEHQLGVIDGNTPPPYEGVTTVQLNNYINKIYIDLIGREPSSSELMMDTDLLRNGNLGDESIEVLLNSIIDTDAYYARLNDIYFGSLLNSLDEINIEYRILTIEIQLGVETDPLIIQYLGDEIEKLNLLLSAKNDYKNDLIDISTYQNRLVNNSFYDEINMGTENFVLACFENFFKRLPTNSELANASTMVDGFPAQLLFNDGATKEKFLEILTTNAEFFQGLSIDIYLQLLARYPTSPEMGNATFDLQEGDINYQELQKRIIKTEEYKGF